MQQCLITLKYKRNDLGGPTLLSHLAKPKRLDLQHCRNTLLRVVRTLERCQWRIISNY